LTWIKIHFNWICESYCNKIKFANSYLTFSELLLEYVPPTDIEYQQIIKVFKSDWINQLSSLKSLYEGFTEFCNEIGLNKDQLLCWFETEEIYPDIKNYLTNNDISHHRESAKRYKDQFKTLWEIHF
jgi:hypothetical protein